MVRISDMRRFRSGKEAKMDWFQLIVNSRHPFFSKRGPINASKAAHIINPRPRIGLVFPTLCLAKIDYSIIGLIAVDVINLLFGRPLAMNIKPCQPMLLIHLSINSNYQITCAVWLLRTRAKSIKTCASRILPEKTTCFWRIIYDLF